VGSRRPESTHNSDAVIVDVSLFVELLLCIMWLETGKHEKPDESKLLRERIPSSVCSRWGLYCLVRTAQ
jgi:hypothetical protein